MHHCSVAKLCVTSVSTHCDETCGQQIHIPPNIALYDGHLHLNQIVRHAQCDFFSARITPSIRDFYLINNKHRPDEWLLPNLFPSLPHIHVYTTIGIHPKYFHPDSVCQNLADLSNHLRLSLNAENPAQKIIAVGECGLDETSVATLDQQMFVFQQQIDLATQFHLPIVLHCRGTHLYKKMFDCLKDRVHERNVRLRWHSVNIDADFHIADLLLNEFPNSLCRSQWFDHLRKLFAVQRLAGRSISFSSESINTRD